MTPEEMNRTIQFLVEHSAHFSTQMEEMQLRHDRNHEVLVDGLNDLRESTARFQAWATEVIAIQSTRLDTHDESLKEAKEFHRVALLLLQRVLDKL